MSDQALACDDAETGTGPAILFLPGSFGTGTGWKPVLGHLGDRYRTITTRLLGDGSTPDTRPDGNATLVTVEDGSHFLPSSHPAQIAALIQQHVDRWPPP